jgi:serine/threonine protein kinase/tetratricopeptide (TPR) repeat protein
MLGGASPADPRVEALYAEWLELHRAGEGSDVAGFIGRQPEELRSRIEERIVEHQRLVGIFHKQDQDIVPGLVVDEDYELIAELGAGATAVVWEARQLSLDRRVAIKFLRLPLALLSDRAQERFQREGRVLAGVQHRGLVDVYATGRHGSVPFLVEELVPGSCSLQQRISDLAEEQRDGATLGSEHDRLVASWFADVARALAAVHAEGILHRDVKPANILLGGDARARIIDFGLAQVDDRHELTGTGESIGTIPYMSPEQLRGGSDASDERSEVFSLGVALYEAITLVRAFSGDSIALIREKILDYDPPDPRLLRSRVPEALAVIARKMIEKDPAHRYQSVGAVAADLEAFIAGEPISAVAPGGVRRTWRWLRRRPWVFASVSMGVALVVSLSIATYLVWRADERADRREALSLSQTVELTALLRSVESETLADRFEGDARRLRELCRGGLDELLPLRAEGYTLLIEAGLEGYDYEHAEELLKEASALGMKRHFRQLSVLTSARILAMQWQDSLAARQFRGALDTLDDQLEELDEFGEDGSGARRVRLEEQIDSILTELVTAALRAYDDSRLLIIQEKWGPPKEFLGRRLESLADSHSRSSPQICEVRFAQGLLLTYFRKWEEAYPHWVQLFRDASNNKKLLGPDHPLTLRIQHELAYCLVRVDQKEPAIAMFEDALSRWEGLFPARGGVHPHANTLVPRWRLGWAHLESQQLEEAERHYIVVVAEMDRSLGADSVVTLQAKTGLAILWAMMGNELVREDEWDRAHRRYEEAIELQRWCVETKNSEMGKSSSSTLISLRGLWLVYRSKARLLEERGDLAEAEEAIRESIHLAQLALELQRSRPTFQPIEESLAGISDYEVCTEFCTQASMFMENPELLLECVGIERLRDVAGALLELKRPAWDPLASNLIEVRWKMSWFLHRIDAPASDQLVRSLLLEALDGFDLERIGDPDSVLHADTWLFSMVLPLFLEVDQDLAEFLLVEQIDRYYAARGSDGVGAGVDPVSSAWSDEMPVVIDWALAELADRRGEHEQADLLRRGIEESSTCETGVYSRLSFQKQIARDVFR